MASLRQIAANRRNAEKSTGPTTDGGKARSRRNAVRHGLAGAGVVLPDEDAEAVARRKEEWRGGYRPAGAEQEWLFEQVVVESVRVDRCRREEAELRTYKGLRASLFWDDDRRLDAENVAASLARNPPRVRRRLEHTLQGCEWLLGRWRLLAAALGDGGAWTDAQRDLALDLLGTPAEFREVMTPDDPAGLVAREVARLEALASDALDDLDAFEQEAAEAGLGVTPDRELAQLRRYEANCLKRLQWARHCLREHTGRVLIEDVVVEPEPVSVVPEPEPEPEPEPAPEPESEPEPAREEGAPMTDAEWEKSEQEMFQILVERAALKASAPCRLGPEGSAPVVTRGGHPLTSARGNRHERRAAAKMTRGR